MPFNLERFFEDIFKPAEGEVVTVMYDMPHDNVADSDAWKERRQMAEDWRKRLAGWADKWHIKVNPTVTYMATGSNNADLPTTGKMAGQDVSMEDVLNGSTILIAMPQFSATAPLYPKAKSSDRLRIASMPGVAKFMEESGLSADYNHIGRVCQKLEKIFNRATAAEVEFSTGHKCFFDLPLENKALVDDGILHPERAGTPDALSNLPAGEVFCVPNENDDSKTNGELPQKLGAETVVYVVKKNRIVDVRGNGDEVEKLRQKFSTDRGWQNIAEFAIGVNDKAKVTGIVLEDEKAGFHWAYGRSDHFGGQCGVDQFSSPDSVVHQDVVYAKDSPIVCKRLDFIFADDTRHTLVVDGELQL
jgi:leucyl aminopeptidase (aminopeptidase T)